MRSGGARLLRLLLAWALLIVAAPASAQAVRLEGPWRFRFGDDPAWAAPDFDDRGWEALEVPGGWRDRYPDDFGFAWYRKRVSVPESLRGGSEPLGILIPAAAHVTEVYVDGRLVGAYGRMPPQTSIHPFAARVMDVPSSTVASDGEVVVAVRVFRHEDWKRAIRPKAGFDAPRPHRFAFGTRASVWGEHAQRREETRERNWLGTSAGAAAAGLLVALMLVSLFQWRSQRERRDYLYFGLFCGCFATQPMGPTFFGLYGERATGFESNFFFVDAAGNLALLVFVAFLVEVLEAPRRCSRWGMRLLALWPVYGIAASLASPLLRAKVWVDTAMIGVTVIMAGALIVFAVRRGRQDGRLLLVGTCVFLVGIVAAVFLFQSEGFQFLGFLLLAAASAVPVITMALVLARRSSRAVADLEASHAASRRFVPADFLALLGKDNVVDVARGESAGATMTVLFADIRGFTSLSERLGPDATFAFMNRYHAVMGPVIAAEGGFINQYYGDGIMALFDGADAALRAAHGMLEALERFNAGQPDPIAIGIGLHTGEVMLGTIGDAERLDTGVIGDAVNTSARIQELTKAYARPLLLSEATQAALASAPPLETVGEVELRGKAEAMTLLAPRSAG